MDEDAYRQLYREVNDRQCLYEKAILSTHCRCSLMRKINLAEREAAHCEDDAGQQRCQAFLDALRHAARFALRTTDEKSSLPHARAMRLQVGGLRGLHLALHPDRPVPSPIPDIHGLIGEGLERWGSLEAFPWQQILREVAAWEGRKPKRRHRKDR